ncbi:MAG: FkbM family methyltransferase [Candidatus Eremiobacteraeota bacterium]|nr:FkbM family methyltransferase [Candidatus Eremiobacteraeota bacterium]
MTATELQDSLESVICKALPPMLSQRLHTALRRWGTPPGRRFLTRTITGSRFRYVTGDVLADTMRACGFWDWRNLAVATALCDPGDTIVEIGAHIGTETLGYSDIVGPFGRVHAFEPEPALRAALEHNLTLNARRNVTVYRAAVGDHVGRVRFTRSSRADNSGAGHVGTQRADGSSSLDVSLVSLDSVADSIGRAALVAMDVEGFEVAVLRGGVQYLSRTRPACLLEACPALLARSGYALSDLYEALESVDYRAFEVGRLALRPTDACAAVAANYERNWLCLPLERCADSARVNRELLRAGLFFRIRGMNPLVVARPSP